MIVSIDSSTSHVSSSSNQILVAVGLDTSDLMARTKFRLIITGILADVG